MGRPSAETLVLIERGKALMQEAFWKQAIEDAKELTLEERLFFLNEIMRLYLKGEIERAKKLATAVAALANSLRAMRLAHAREAERRPTRGSWRNKLPT